LDILLFSKVVPKSFKIFKYLNNLKPKILFVTNVDWFFISHRIAIAEEAKSKGFEVIVAAEDTGRSQEIINKGIRFINLSFSRSGTNPVL